MPSLSMDDEAVGLPNVRSRLKSMCDGELIVAARKGSDTVVTIRIPETR